MIYYFSGTGNSTFVATTLGNFLDLQQAFIPELEPSNLELKDERLILVFPVYSWGVPPLITKFIEELPDSLIDRIKSAGLPIDCVMTCGDEVALAPEMIIKTLKKRDLEINSIWSVIMPNNYVLLPGFDVDSKEVENAKLENCQGRIMEIAQALSRREKRVDVTRGNIAWLKTKLVFPLFKKWGVFPRKWHYRQVCIGCGKCEKICPLINIKMENGHPVWGNRCCSCLGCYHICPVHAVEYGNETKRKGQYFKKISSLNYHK